MGGRSGRKEIVVVAVETEVAVEVAFLARKPLLFSFHVNSSSVCRVPMLAQISIPRAAGKIMLELI